MTDDKDKDNGGEVGGIKDRLRDEFDEASGKKKDDKDTKSSKGGDKNPGGVKDHVKDEFDEATGKKKGKNDQDAQDEGGKDS